MAGCPVCLKGEPRFAVKAVLYAGAVRDIHDCARCGASYYYPVPTGAEIGRCYPPVYFEGFFRQYWKDYYKGRAFAERLSAWKPEGDFLDVGCALGTMLAGLRDHSKWRVRGVEFSAAAADLGSRLNGLEIKPVPITGAPFPEGSFDFVHINNVLEHESDPRAALAAAARLLKPGGRLELTVPNGPVDLLPNRTLAAKWGKPVPTRHGGHLFFFSRRTLESLLPECGLRVLSIRAFHLKLGAKARGWLPRSYKQFAKELKPVDAHAPPPSLSLEEGRARIPEPRNWTMYRLSDRWRRLWRFPNGEFGYDFEVLAEKA